MPTVTSENKAEFDRDFMAKKNGKQESCPSCGEKHSNVTVLDRDQMTEKYKNKLKNYYKGDMYKAIKSGGMSDASVNETLSNVTEGDKSYCGNVDKSGKDSDIKFAFHK